MNPQVLVKDSEKYGGQYVATRSFRDREVVASADTPVAVKAAAAKLGVDAPVIFFVPVPGTVSVY